MKRFLMYASLWIFGIYSCILRCSLEMECFGILLDMYIAGKYCVRIKK